MGRLAWRVLLLWLATEETEALYTAVIFRQLFDSLVTVLGAGD
jgi:hypothetical protein